MGQNWKDNKKISTTLKCLECGNTFYSGFIISEDCPSKGMGHNHKIEKYWSEEANDWVDESYTSGGAISKEINLL